MNRVIGRPGGLDEYELIVRHVEVIICKLFVVGWN